MQAVAEVGRGGVEVGDGEGEAEELRGSRTGRVRRPDQLQDDLAQPGDAGPDRGSRAVDGEPEIRPRRRRVGDVQRADERHDPKVFKICLHGRSGEREWRSYPPVVNDGSVINCPSCDWTTEVV